MGYETIKMPLKYVKVSCWEVTLKGQGFWDLFSLSVEAAWLLEKNLCPLRDYFDLVFLGLPFNLLVLLGFRLVYLQNWKIEWDSLWPGHGESS